MRKTLKLVKNILLISVLMIAAGAAQLHAQTYPVQVSTQIAPPFSPYLSDYSAVGAQRFMVNFLLKDPTLPEYRCKLRLTIEGVGITIRTKQSFVPQPLVLPGGGIPLQLYGEELEEYFNPNNLDFAGFSKAQYTKGAKLPDGVYRFTVEVLDYNRGTVVSNKGTTVAFIILNDPPLLNLPRTDTKVRILDPTNIPFTWTPRHTGSPNAAFTTEYIFRLVEIWPATRNPYDAFLSQQPLYEITTSATQIVYGPAEPALIPGRKYAWQVQARDVEGRDLFKNQGKSEVFVFQFGDALGAPEGLYLQTANPTSLVVRWEQNVAGTDAVKYRVRYRPHKDRAHDNWYEAESEEQWRALSQLQPETEYEVQVRAEQSVQVSEYSPVKVFKTALPGANEFVCKSDVSPPPIPTTNAPAVRLGINDTIHAGGYDVLVRELSESNNGVYSGAGMAIVPWFMSAKVAVTFKKINVNEQHWLTSGEIKSVWNPDSKFLVTPDKKPDPSTRPMNGEVPVPVAETETLVEIGGAVIVDVSKNEDGDIEVNTSDGETKTLEKGKSYSVVDAAGNGYIVDKEGNVTKTTAQEARDAAGRGDRNYTIALRFEKGMAVFGFDEKKYDALASNYQQLEGGQYIPWKAVTSSRQDVVNAVLEGTDIDPKKVRFEVNGSPVTHSGFTGGVSTVNVPGKAEGTVEELLALYKPSDGADDNVLGKLNMVSYDQISRNLVIVPVNNATLPGNPSDVTLSQELTKIYGQAVADWKVSIAPNSLKVTLDEYFDDGGSGLLSNYTADMKKVINAFGNLQEKTYYLFLVEKPRSGTGARGYMPRSKQAGFIFSDNLTNANAIPTIAHELGHGAFNLQHTFSEFPVSKGSTDNLMDYNNGTALYKYQWDHVHDPQTVIGLFEDDADGALVGDDLPEGEAVPFAVVLVNGKVDDAKFKELKGRIETSSLSPDDKLLLVKCYTEEDVKNRIKEHEDSGYLDKANGKVDDSKFEGADIPSKKIYYFGEKPVISAFPVAINKKGKITLLKTEVKSSDTDISVVFLKDYYFSSSGSGMSSGTSSVKLIFQYDFELERAMPQLYYNAAHTGPKEGVKVLNGALNIYGRNTVEVETFLRSYNHYEKNKNDGAIGDASLDRPKEETKEFVHAIQAGQQNGVTTKVDDWVAVAIENDKTSCEVKIIPLFGDPVTNVITKKEAPNVTILKNSFHGDGSVGLDSYDSYKSLDVKGVFAKEYTKDKNGQYVPLIVYTAHTPPTIKLEIETADNSTVDGLCSYQFTCSDGETKIDPVGIDRSNKHAVFEFAKPKSAGSIVITDLNGNIKGEIKLVDKTATNRGFNVALGTIKYDTKVSVPPKSDLSVSLNKTFGHLGKACVVRDNVVTFEIKDDDFKNGITWNGRTHAKEVVKNLLVNGATSEEEGKKYADILHYFHKAKIASVLNKADYQVIYAPTMLQGPYLGGWSYEDKYMFIVPPYKSTPLTVAHEIGHNMSLKHIGVELGQCADNQKTDCEGALKTNNIMGYSGGESFWHWQEPKLKFK